MPESTTIAGAARRLKDVQLRVAMAALVVMMMTIVFDVTLRYTLGKPIHGAYDVVECSLVVFVFHGLTACFLSRQNIVIDLIDTMVSDRMLAVLIRMGDIVTVGLLALMAWAMVTPALQAYDYGDKKLELGLPLWVLWAVAIAGLLGTLACAAAVLFQPITRRHGGERM